MLLTEEEARKKSCPLWSIAGVLAAAANARLEGKGYDGERRCTASECMMWRGGSQKQVEVSRGVYATASAGYCGLAGKPEGA